MRFLVASQTPSILREIERSIGASRVCRVEPDGSCALLGVERFAAVLADNHTPLEHLVPDIPVVLAAPMERETLRAFRRIAEAGLDVRLWPLQSELSETTGRSASAAKAPNPAAVIVRETRGVFRDPAADVVTATALLADERRSLDEVARACVMSAGAVRATLRDHHIAAITDLMAQMRCLHALWAWEIGQQTTFWSAAGFRTLAEVSEFMSRHTGAPVGRWKVAGGFSMLLRQFVASCESATHSSERRVG